jgi:hypothetical protein
LQVRFQKLFDPIVTWIICSKWSGYIQKWHKGISEL